MVMVFSVILSIVKFFIGGTFICPGSILTELFLTMRQLTEQFVKSWMESGRGGVDAGYQQGR
jgi:hypothetical protein